jgi:hypothetical protein
MTVTNSNPPPQRIRIEGCHFRGLTAPVPSPAFLLKKLALHPLVARISTLRRKREEASRMM